jgi:ABC-type sugar transport system permease subunit
MYIRRLNRTGILFFLPALIYLVLFLLLPIVTSVVLSFTDYSIIGKADFTGWKNYIRIFSMKAFTNSLKVTAVYVVTRLTFIVILAFFMAFVVNAGLPFKGFFQAVYFMPYVFPLAVTSIIWKLFFQPMGLVEQLYAFVGMEPLYFLASRETALAGITISTVWSAAGYYSIIILAALQTIPKDVLEAAVIDGAGSVRKFMFIILPYLKPTIFYILVVGTINSIRGFPPFMIMTQGGPGNATRVIGLMVYEQGFVHLKMGTASAMSVILLIIILTITMIQRQFLKGEQER